MTGYKIEDAVSGAAAGVVGTVLGFPFDTIKSTMQTSNEKVSIGNVMKRIYVHDGIAGFYRGLLSPLLALTILNTVNFASYNYFHRSFREMTSSSSRFMNNDQFRVSIDGTVTLAAMCVGPIASTISTPFELIKLQLQTDRTTGANQIRKYTGSFDATVKIVRTYGISYLYVGHVINTSREVVFLGTYFTVYETIRHLIGRKFETIGIPLSGGIAGALGWFISFPLDCIKSQIQAQDLSKKNLTSWKVTQQLFKTKGIVGLYSGVLPSITRAFIVSSSRFTAYEMVQSLFRNDTY